MKVRFLATLAAVALVSPTIDAVPLPTTADTATVTIEDVGDVESFGRSVTYLGFAESTRVRLRPDCSSQPPEQRRPLGAGAGRDQLR